MKKYLLFYGDQYYPDGGWSDFKGDFDTTEECLKNVAKIKPDWYEIVDIKKKILIISKANN